MKSVNIIDFSEIEEFSNESKYTYTISKRNTRALRHGNKEKIRNNRIVSAKRKGRKSY